MTGTRLAAHFAESIAALRGEWARTQAIVSSRRLFPTGNIPGTQSKECLEEAIERARLAREKRQGGEN